MTEQVEKVARAIHKARQERGFGGKAAWEYEPHTIHELHRYTAQAAITATLPDDSVARIVALEGALRPFADCMQYIKDDEDDEEWAKFRLLVKDYRTARAVLGETTSAEGSG